MEIRNGDEIEISDNNQIKRIQNEMGKGRRGWRKKK
jgi:hypothetical protein